MSPAGSAREVVLLTLGSFVAIGFFSYLPLVIPFLGPYSSALIAASFIYLPAAALWRRGETFSQVGVRWGPRQAWKPLLVVLAVVFPLFAVGFFGWQHVLYDRAPCLDAAHLADWNEALYKADLTSLQEGLVLTKNDRDHLVLVNHTDAPARVRVTWQPQPEGRAMLGTRTPDGGYRLLMGIPTPAAVPDLAPDEVLVFAMPPGPARVTVEGGSTGSLWEGNMLHQELPYTATRDWSWLWTFILVQLLLVAMPEEVFYRGYLQTRLQARLGRIPLWGGDIGPAVWLTSAIFALGHLVAIPSPGRLAVFFPSLLFGWLRDRTGSVTAPIVLHALSNLLLAVLSKLAC